MYAPARSIALGDSPRLNSYFGRMGERPNAQLKAELRKFEGVIVTNGFDQDLDFLNILAVGDQLGARQNFLANRFNLTPSATAPTFTPYRGFTGVPASSTTLTATGWVPSSAPAATKFSLDDACAGVWTRTAASYDGATSRIDLYTATGRMGRRQSTSNQYGIRLNDGTSINVALASVADQAGHFTAQRTAANARALYRNGIAAGSDAQASTTVATGFVLFGTTGNFSDAQLSASYAGRAISAARLAVLHDALSALLSSSAIGAI